MDGKIALEEHFALADTWAESAPPALPEALRAHLHARLLDFHGPRLREMDAAGVEFAILSMNAPTVQAVLDTAEAVALARRSNDALAEEVAKRPDRFAGFAALPMQDPEAASAELARCVRELGFKGAMVNGFTQKGEPDSAVYYDVPEYRPFWATVQELGAPFYLHPRMQIPARAQAYEGHAWLAGASWGFARETSIHALRLIGSALFDDFPGLQIVLGHLGERIPFDMWRIDARVAAMPFDYPCKRPVGAYLRENFHVTTSGNFSGPAFRCALAEMGAARTMFSLDYPFEDMAQGAAWFDGTDIDEADRRRIGRTNAIELFALDLD